MTNLNPNATILVNEKTGKKVVTGDTVTTFRGDKRELFNVHPQDGMNGKVNISGDDFAPLHYPGVINCKFVTPEEVIS